MLLLTLPVSFLLGVVMMSVDVPLATHVPSEWTLVWSDEFTIDGIPDPTKWTFDLGDACDRPMGCGWGNNELQYYTSDLQNARVENGRLILEAHEERIKNSAFSSARIKSQGLGDWRYGRIDIRAKLPTGKGTWAAIWMLPSAGTNAAGKFGPWPHSGEIDIMEYVGHSRDTIHANTHTLAHNGMHGTDLPGSIHVSNVEDDFHTYTLEWHHDRLDFFIDQLKFHTYLRQSGYEKWPFDEPFHLILNLAVGGSWGGKLGVDKSIWPQKMEIEYVRVYQTK